VTRPYFVQAAAQAVSANQPRRFGVIASCIVAGAILAAAGAQVQNPVLEADDDEMLALAERSSATHQVAPVAPFEFVAVTIGRNDTLDQIFRGLQLKLSDLAELRSLPDVRIHQGRDFDDYWHAIRIRRGAGSGGRWEATLVVPEVALGSRLRLRVLTRSRFPGSVSRPFTIEG
jgi:hypothetical protein